MYGNKKKEFDYGNMLMWLCQIVYVDIILGGQID